MIGKKYVHVYSMGSIFACTFIKTLFTCAATAKRTLRALICTIEKSSIRRLCRLSLYAPVLKDWGHIVLPVSVCLSAQT